MRLLLAVTMTVNVALLTPEPSSDNAPMVETTVVTIGCPKIETLFKIGRWEKAGRQGDR